jgi:hypothetical protein
MPSLSVARGKEGIVDYAPGGNELPQAHLSFLALILAHAAPVAPASFCKKKLDIFTKIITLIRCIH